MSHTAYIDYLNSIKQGNSDTISNNDTNISSLTASIQAYQDQITLIQAQIQGYENANSTLQSDNAMIDDIIALL